MLNIQVRGSKVESVVGSISQEQINQVFDDIKDKKYSLAEIMLNSEWQLHDDIFSSSTPIITSESELIITSYDSNDYYSEGHSFFRSKVTDIMQKIPIQNSIDFKDQFYIIAHCAISYGNSFETELNDLDYKFFDKESISITSSTYPYFRLPVIKDLFLNNIKLVDLKRQKNDLRQFISTIYKKRSSDDVGFLSSDNFLKFYDVIIDSKIDIGLK